MVMKQVRIAELKAKLSECLRTVQNGESLTVLDRNRSIAQIVPVRERLGLRIRKPALGAPAPNKVPLPKPVKLDLDVLELLLEERQGNR
jgi:prevent-host-death family protein